jgi:hypothetical protein
LQLSPWISLVVSELRPNRRLGLGRFGGATELYVIRTSICHRRLSEESNRWILGRKKENDVGLTHLVGL